MPVLDTFELWWPKEATTKNASVLLSSMSMDGSMDGSISKTIHIPLPTRTRIKGLKGICIWTMEVFCMLTLILIWCQ